MNWTPLQKGYPTIGRPIILTLQQDDGSRTVEVGYVDASRKLHIQTGKDVTQQVVAWMPLPDPCLGDVNRF